MSSNMFWCTNVEMIYIKKILKKPLLNGIYLYILSWHVKRLVIKTIPDLDK